MPELRPGDDVVVETVDHTYAPTSSTRTRASVGDYQLAGAWVLDPLPKNPDGGAAATAASGASA